MLPNQAVRITVCTYSDCKSSENGISSTHNHPSCMLNTTSRSAERIETSSRPVSVSIHTACYIFNEG